MSGLAIPL